MSNSVCHQTYVVFTEFQMLSFFFNYGENYSVSYDCAQKELS